MMLPLLGALVLTAAAPQPAQSEETPLVQRAASAWSAFKVGEAQALYERLAADRDAAPVDRAVARRELARIAWLVDGDAARASALLVEALPSDPDPCPTGLLYARILNEDAGAALAAIPLDDLAQTCARVEPRLGLERVRARLIAAGEAQGPDREARLAEAAALFAGLSEETREGPAGHRLRLSLGLLRADPQEALAGWLGYLLLGTEAEAPQGLGLSRSEAAAVFGRGLSQDAEARDRLRLAELLMRSGFHEDLRRFVADHGLGDRDTPEARRVGAYLALRSELDRRVLEHDRGFARRGEAGGPEYEAALQSAMREAATAAGSDRNDLWEALGEAFNLFGTTGRSNGVPSLHLGHRVVDEELRIVQEDRSGSLRFIAIDNMLHNGFSSWLADGASGVGGWAAEGELIVQVRPRLLDLAEEALAVARPGPARDRRMEEIARLRARDGAIVAGGPIAFLPGVRAQLRLRGIDDLSRAAEAAPTGSFAERFRHAYIGSVFASAIVAHEGRHALDQVECVADAALSNGELEYRAKLSEIIYAPTPRLALASIYSPLFGGTTGHGEANRRLAMELVKWIEAHPEAIVGFDPGLSPLEHLPNLEGDQLREIARSLDQAAQGCGMPPADAEHLRQPARPQ